MKSYTPLITKIDNQEHLNNNMKKSLKSGLNLITVFIFNIRYHKQTKGAPWNHPHDLLAEFQLRLLENNMIKNIKSAPSTRIRNVNIFAVWDHGLPTLKDFQGKLNKVNSNIQPTMELENNNTVPIHRYPTYKRG